MACSALYSYQKTHYPENSLAEAVEGIATIVAGVKLS